MVHMPCGSLDEKRQLWIRSLEEKIKHIEHAKRYAGAPDLGWLETFSHDQLAIIDYLVQCHWPINFTFTWSFGM